MRWRRLIVLVVVVLLVMTTGAVGTPSGGPATERVRPFKITMEITGAAVGLPGTLGCDEGWVPGYMSGTGRATHMGRITVEGTVCQHPETGELTDGSGTYTAVNGVALFAEFGGQGYLNPDGTFTGEGYGILTGGTGRFVSATGEWTWTMSGSYLPDGSSLTSLRGRGWISF